MPQFFSALEHPVMLGANQKMQIGRRDPCAIIQIRDVRFSIPADQDGCLGHLGSDTGSGLEGLYPAGAFLLVDGLLVTVRRIGDRFPRPDLGPSTAQGDTIQTKGLQTVQQQSTAGLAIVSDRPKPFCLLERVIAQGRGVLSQNYHLLRRHASPGIVLMRSHEALKLQIRSAIFNEGIGGFAARLSAEAGIKTPVRMSPAVLQHPTKTPMERDMAQIQSVQLFLDPVVLRALAEDGTGHHHRLSLIHISEPTRRTPISYAVFCLKK